MNRADKYVRMSRGRRIVGFILFIPLGFLAVVIQGLVPELFGVRVEWFLIFIVYVGIYKSPGLCLIITAVLGLIFDLSSSSPVGQGFFCAFFAMGAARVISSLIYADRPPIMFLTTAAITLGLNAILVVIFLLTRFGAGEIGFIFRHAFFSSLLTAILSVPLFLIIKFIDPERGGYYFTRFMREEEEIPLI
jgi:rod shape-determining protein MreD